MEVWKIIFLSKWSICRFHVDLPACTVRIRVRKLSKAWHHFEDPKTPLLVYRFIHPSIVGSLGILTVGLLPQIWMKDMEAGSAWNLGAKLAVSFERWVAGTPQRSICWENFLSCTYTQLFNWGNRWETLSYTLSFSAVDKNMADQGSRCFLFPPRSPSQLDLLFQYLVGGWTNPFEKYYIVKLDHFLKDPGENKQIFEITV